MSVLVISAVLSQPSLSCGAVPQQTYARLSSHHMFYPFYQDFLT